MATNPILAELDGLSPGAKAALAQAHGTALQNTMGTQAPQMQKPAPGGPAPTEPIRMEAPGASSVPQMGQSPQPNVTLGPQPRGTLAGDQQAVQKLAKPAALETVYSKIANSGFGQNHPIAGKVLGGLAQIPATVADIGASAVAPRLGALIPGTSINRGLQLKGLEDRIGQEEGNAEKEAQTTEMNARAPLEQAQAAHYGDSLDLQKKQLAGQLAEHGLSVGPDGKIILDPSLQRDQWKPVAGVQGPNGEPMESNEATGMYRVAPGASNASMVGADKTTTKEKLQQQIDAASAKGDTAAVKQLQDRMKAIDPEGQQRIGFTIQNQANTAQRARDQKTESEYTWTRNDLNKQLETYETQNGKLSEAASMVGQGAMGAALGSVKALSGLAAGQGSGVRITQAELNSIARARGFKGDFDAFLQQFGDGNKLTPEQVTALKAIISDIQRVAGVKGTVINKVLDDLGDAPDTKTVRTIYSQARHALAGAQ